MMTTFSLYTCRRFSRLTKPRLIHWHTVYPIMFSSKSRDLFQYHMTGDNCCKIDEETVRPRAVVFLLGWTGSQPKHLVKYAALHENKGITVIRYCPSSNLMFGFDPEKTLTNHAEELIKVLYLNKLQELPLIFHCFSNGGAVMYYLLSKQLEKQEHQMIKLAGCILDSSPALMDNRRTLEALASVVPGNIFTKYFFGMGAIFFLWISYGFNRTKDLFTGNPTEAYRLWVWYSLVEQPKLCPQLFLFSRNDKIASMESIQLFASRRKQLGVEVFTKIFKDSQHVQHLRIYPEDYADQVDNFLSICLPLEHQKGFLAESLTEFEKFNQQQKGNIDQELLLLPSEL